MDTWVGVGAAKTLTMEAPAFLKAARVLEAMALQIAARACPLPEFSKWMPKLALEMAGQACPGAVRAF